MSYARKTTLTFYYVLIFPEAESLCRSKFPYCLRYIHIVGTYVRSNRSVACNKNNSCFVFVLVISP